MLNRQLLEQAKAEYDSGNYSGALRGYYECLREPGDSFGPGEHGLVYHMLGNCLVKMRNFKDASNAYEKALQDPDYDNLTAVHSNYGLALSSLGDYRKAIEQFELVLKDPSYKTPYKTYSGMGNAYMQLGDFASAGTAFRNAAVDERNPTPVKALLNLGVCFMGLNRPGDAIETYKAIFEFNPDPETLSKTYANLGQAYVAQGSMKDAVEAFENALRDDNYELSEAAQADYLKASRPQPLHDDSGIDAIGDSTDVMGFSGIVGAVNPPEEVPFEDDEMLGAGIPAADKSGFFTLPDEGPDNLSVLLEQGGIKKRRRGLRVLLVIVIILLLLVVAGGVLFWQGFGFPSQQQTIQDLFSKNAAGQDASDCWIATSDAEQAARIGKIMESVAKTDNISIDYLEPGMMESEAIVTATLPEGGTVRYDITMVRDFSSLTRWIGWKVNSVEFAMPSTQDSLSVTSTSSGESGAGVDDVSAAPAADNAAQQPAADAAAQQPAADATAQQPAADAAAAPAEQPAADAAAAPAEGN